MLGASDRWARKTRSDKMAEMKKFLYDYFALLNMRAMPEAVLSHYNELIKKNDFPNDDVKSWKNKFMVAGADGKYDIKKDFPDIKNLIDGRDTFEFDNLYLAFHDVFSSMAQNRDNYQGNAKVLEFIDKYFGPGKVFENTPIEPAVKAEIGDLVRLLTSNTDAMAASGADREQIATLHLIQRNPSKIDNIKTRNTLFSLVRTILYNLQNGEMQANVANLFSGIGLNSIFSELQKEVNITDNKRKLFEKNYKNIFETLYSKDKIYSAFKENDHNRTISRQIDDALQFTDYTGKKNADNLVKPKYKDDLNIWQKIDKFNKDTYKNVLKKYVTAHRDNIFIKPEAKAIFDAIDKAKISPKDGLEKIIEQADAIKGNLAGKEPFKAAKHFGWMIENLKKMKDNGYGKAISTALRNRRKMRKLIEKIVIDAVKDDKIAEAKTTMEVLSVMQYGLFDSRTMDAVNQTDFSLFSDSNLSWNKSNEGVQFVTKALDKTIKAGVQVAGYGITALANGTRRIGSNLRGSEALEKLSQARKTELAREKATWQADKIKEDKEDNDNIAKNNLRIKKTGIKDDGDLKAQKDKLEKGERAEASLKKKFEKKQAEFAKFEKIENDYDNWTKLQASKASTLSDIAKIRAELRAMPNPAPDQEAEFEAELKKESLKQKETELQNIENKLSGMDGKALAVEYTKIHTVAPGMTDDPYTIAQKAQNAAKDRYEKKIKSNRNLNNKIQTFEEATSENKLLQKTLDDRDKADKNWDKDHKNQYEELMAYWDFLQSGKTKTKMFQFATNRVQKKMDKTENGNTKNNMTLMMEAWAKKKGYGIAA